MITRSTGQDIHCTHITNTGVLETSVDSDQTKQVDKMVRNVNLNHFLMHLLN